MHVDHELVEFVPADEQDYEKIIEEYEEEVLVQEEVLEPFVADFVDPPPAQVKGPNMARGGGWIAYLKIYKSTRAIWLVWQIE